MVLNSFIPFNGFRITARHFRTRRLFLKAPALTKKYCCCCRGLILKKGLVLLRQYVCITVILRSIRPDGIYLKTTDCTSIPSPPKTKNGWKMPIYQWRLPQFFTERSRNPQSQHICRLLSKSLLTGATHKKASRRSIRGITLLSAKRLFCGKITAALMRHQGSTTGADTSGA